VSEEARGSRSPEVRLLPAGSRCLRPCLVAHNRSLGAVRCRRSGGSGAVSAGRRGFDSRRSPLLPSGSRRSVHPVQRRQPDCREAQGFGLGPSISSRVRRRPRGLRLGDRDGDDVGHRKDGSNVAGRPGLGVSGLRSLMVYFRCSHRLWLMSPSGRKGPLQYRTRQSVRNCSPVPQFNKNARYGPFDTGAGRRPCSAKPLQPRPTDGLRRSSRSG
jgi:hypothetical protein